MCSLENKDGHHSDAPLNFFVERYTEVYVNKMNTFGNVGMIDKSVPVVIEDDHLTVIYKAAAKLSGKEKGTEKIFEIVPDLKTKY